jgi:hypothetical protein
MRFILPWILLGMCGCGTLSNLQGKSGCGPMVIGGVEPIRPYGGIRNSVKWIKGRIGFQESKQSRKDKTVPPKIAPVHENPLSYVIGVPIFGYHLVVDPILSTIGDTISLPYALTEYRKYTLRSSESVQSDESNTPITNARLGQIFPVYWEEFHSKFLPGI